MGKPFRRTRHAVAYFVGKLFLTLVKIIPRWIVLPCSAIFSLIVGQFLKPIRREIMQNLDRVFGDTKTEIQKRIICRQVLMNQGITACDAIKIPELSQKKFKKIVKSDLSIVHEVLRNQKNGAVVIGGHVSCFELQSHLFAMDGIPVVTIGAPLFDKRIDREVEKLRSRNGITYLTRTGSARKVIRELKSGKVFISLIDQDATNDGVFANFLGHLAFTPSGPIRMAIHFNVPLFFFHLQRQKDYTYKFVIEGPIAIPEGSDDQQRLVLAQQFNNMMSTQIEKCPEQWVWMHRRWKRKHSDFPDLLSTESKI